MKAYIKKDKWLDFKFNHKKYGFVQPKSIRGRGYIKKVDNNIALVVINKTRELQLITTLGCSPFMEVQQDSFKDLYNDDYIEFKKGRFD